MECQWLLLHSDTVFHWESEPAATASRGTCCSGGNDLEVGLACRNTVDASFQRWSCQVGLRGSPGRLEQKQRQRRLPKSWTWRTLVSSTSLVEEGRGVPGWLAGSWGRFFGVERFWRLVVKLDAPHALLLGNAPKSLSHSPPAPFDLPDPAEPTRIHHPLCHPHAPLESLPAHIDRSSSPAKSTLFSWAVVVV